MSVWVGGCGGAQSAHRILRLLLPDLFELDLLRYFGEHPHRVLSRDELMEKVWKLRNYSYTRTVDNFIARLRRHFEENPSQPQHFLSVRGAGYKFVPDPDATATAS